MAVGAIWRQPLFGVPALAALVAFCWLVWRHSGLRRTRDRSALQRQLAEEALHRARREWDEIPLREGVTAERAHPYATDLDLTGRASLLHLLDTATSPMGSAALAGWLLTTIPADGPARDRRLTEVRERQEAVRELADRLELREELQLRGRLRQVDTTDAEPFLAWCEAEPEAGGWARAAWTWAAWLSPLLLWGLLAAWLARLVPAPVWIVFLLTNLALWQLRGGVGERALGAVRRQQGAVRQYGEQLDLLTRADLQAPVLRGLQESMKGSGAPPPRELARLDRILALAVPPSSMGYAVAQSLLLCNLHVANTLERWRRRSGREVRRWLDALGELEALAAFAALRHAHPDWAFPELEEGSGQLTGEQLGHPLLDPRVRVDNDVRLGPPGSFLLVTGSNMSGKTTLLRAVGANVVLANAGAPVCARAFRLPPVRLWTSMRIEDSLERGVSYFLAEVRRLREIVQAARDTGEGAPMVCYLLDEVLQGTNTAERQVAARAVLRHLAGLPTLGVVTTHDLTLADAPELAGSAHQVHFTEQVNAAGGAPSMTFDYRLRPGPATSTNALRLLESMGLLDG
ncbi:MAG TPA: DNA mismatch repair protein MutS [Candidatus Binatia bacterium]|nr:DNA mismatch repair protein MutS [Candidatus Binatia bacterium]